MKSWQRKFLKAGFLSLALIMPVLLRATPTQKNDFPVIKITISAGQYSQLHKSRGKKLELKDALMTINGDTAHVKDVHARGNNSLKFNRKSLSVDLDKTLKLKSAGKNVSIKKFHLLNLVMDKNLWHNRWAFLTMSELGIFPLFNTYCTVWINDQPEGIYLLVEKPHHSMATKKSPYMIRRGVGHTVGNEYDDTGSKDLLKNYRKQFKAIYEPGELTGQALFEYYCKLINLENYFTWIAFNYLIMNGDYADEVFFYINPETNLYEIIPWDYDDIFVPQPHEGMEARNAALKYHMLYSLEDSFDKSIASDEVVYSKYISTLIDVLNTCDSTLLLKTANRIMEELTLLSEDTTSSKVTKFLDRDSFNLENARSEIKKSIDFLITRRNSLIYKLGQ